MTKTISIRPVILCGGSGSRLWPLSRAGFPKQFLCLTGRESLFQQTAKRLQALAAPNVQLQELVVVTNEEHRFLVQEQLREVGITLVHIVLEPEAKNTAPALTLAALLACQDGQSEAVLVVVPADQTLADAEQFASAIHTAARAAQEEAIVVLGVKPTRIETGYGYIKTKQQVAGSISSVEQFVEKPSASLAQQYVESGQYFWNAGMFVLKASSWLAALEVFRPEMAKTVQLAWDDRQNDQSFVRPDAKVFASVTSESIDYAVMEHCPSSRFSLLMVPLSSPWSDLGAWDAVWDAVAKDEKGNALTGDVLLTSSHNNFVYAQNRLVALAGVKNLVVVETPDAVLVADRNCAQEVKTVVARLNDEKRGEHVLHRKVHRPWGWYDSVDEGERFKVKRIQVNAGASLSLQKHHHRAEHWIVVKGTALVRCGDKEFLLTENQSTYIPLGEVHRLSNPGITPLEIIEVQTGSYFGEDDIVRLEDNYGRGGA